MEKIEQTLTSMEVAEMVEKEHNKLLRDIRSYSKQLDEAKIGQSDFFTESTYVNARGKEYPCYLVTKKGCEFIAHKLTGVKGTAFTARYINRFHEMEDKLESGDNTFNDRTSREALVDELFNLVIKQQNQIDAVIRMQNQMLAESKKQQEQEPVLVVGTKKNMSKIDANENPFTLDKKVAFERCRSLARKMRYIGELKGLDDNRVWHLMYCALSGKIDVSLDEYRNVLNSETGEEYGTLETIAHFKWIYEAAEKICKDTIDKYTLF